jgi:hypothetical protein
LFGAGLGRDAVGAVAFDANAAENAAKNGKAYAGNEIQDGIGEMAGEIGVEEDGHAGVDKHGEDIAEGASRHVVPPGEGRREAVGPLGAQSNA